MNCLDDVKAWTAQDILYFNEEKLEVIVLGGTSVTSPLSLASLAQFAKPIMNNLGITVQANLKFDCKIKTEVKARCFHSKQMHVCNLHEMQLHVFYR